jgi:hypothetical protein
MNEILVIVSKFIKMKNIYISIFYLLFTVIAFSQEKSNPKINKNETEISSFIMADNSLAYGGEIVYRLSVIKNLKIGGGLLYGVNGVDPVNSDISGYGAVFADAIQFLGRRQKWGFGGQIGHGIYNRDYGSLKQKAGIYYSISSNYRAIVSGKLLLNISLFLGYRNFHYKETQGLQPENSGFVGFRLGIVF